MKSTLTILRQLALASVIFLLLAGCTKMKTNGHLTQAGVAFTFDDFSVSEWYECLPLFDSFNVKATYYISNYSSLHRSDVRKLKIMQQHGHEIAYHSANHYNMVKFASNAGMDKLIKQEVLAGLARMQTDGFYPTTFAYPFGQHDEALDRELLKYFKSVRALNGTNNYAKSMATVAHNRILYGLGIDESSKRPMATILQLVQNTYASNTCLVLVAHHVNHPYSKFNVTLPILRTIIKEAADKGMHFYTISEISE